MEILNQIYLLWVYSYIFLVNLCNCVLVGKAVMKAILKLLSGRENGLYAYFLKAFTSESSLLQRK